MRCYPAFGLATGVTAEELGGMGIEWATGAAHIGEAIWHEFMPAALAKGSFQAKPDPLVIKGGLSKVQEGIDMLRKGVSAKKVVIEVGGEA